MADVPADVREDTEGHLVHTTVFGMDYVCPEDFNDWVRAGAALHPVNFAE